MAEQKCVAAQQKQEEECSPGHDLQVTLNDRNNCGNNTSKEKADADGGEEGEKLR